MPANLDALTAGKITNPASAVGAALSATILDQGKTAFSPIAGRGNAVVFMGDSHTERGSIPRVGAAGSVELGGMVGMILTRVQSLRYRFNAGISGEDTTQMRARWAADVAAYNPTVLHILGGTNDITGGLSDATTLANLQWMTREGKKLGCLVFIGTIPPRNDSDVALDNIDRINVGIKALAASEGAHLIDYHAALVNPANGYFAAGLTTDLVHANQAGQRVMANTAASVMNRVLPQGSLPVGVSQYATSPNRLGTNCCFLTDSNGDGVPDGWTAGGTATTSTISLVTDSDFVGKALKLEYTGANNRNVTTSITSDKWAVGQRVAFTGKYKAIGVEAGNSLFTISLTFNNSTVPNYQKLRPVNQASNVNTDGVGTFYIEGVIPAGTNIIYAQINAISGAGTLMLGQVAMWIINADGAAV
ncbi:GDSL-type esterase/lipase family protein [Arthrobacter sp. Leaf137]|uniref:SGNH/GDSL hydrolase family protein n=1 Tax=Arthrobacter sp. Leaf137 TaxID=1736271 RepID=UPI00138ED987|nr:GDSL-type esterase/lipase family protein [Arthrobacter sp. Leaf137]